ncbi:hypothetical protein AB0B30_18965 [Streptomyces narbonensis]|uniref:Uncharacterized protein n=1 Tax=Streptomyces narbonensis TaxID=67333 RepID=A0ABV3C6K7_9ACTN
MRLAEWLGVLRDELGAPVYYADFADGEVRAASPCRWVSARLAPAADLLRERIERALTTQAFTIFS